jgi:TetR/AcrR family transcriptional repressor of nem operon
MMDVIQSGVSGLRRKARTMGYSREDKAKSHDRILEITAERIRQEGTAAPGVAEIMKAAGLTHGGFYKHFSSRDDLVAEAVECALAQGDGTMADIIDGQSDPLAAFVDQYASREHCEQPGEGCAVVSLGGDVAHGDDRMRAAYRDRVASYLTNLEALVGGDPATARQRAVASLSALVGGVLVARAMGDDPLADEVLADVRSAVKTQSFGG